MSLNDPARAYPGPFSSSIRFQVTPLSVDFIIIGWLPNPGQAALGARCSSVTRYRLPLESAIGPGNPPAASGSTPWTKLDGTLVSRSLSSSVGPVELAVQDAV